MNETHPSPETIEAFALGRLGAAERSAVEAHVAGCPACCRSLEQVKPDSLVGLAQAAMATLTSGAFDTPGPNPETLFHDHPRYRLIGRLGAGGMGAVYKAEHTVMGRMVALKFVAPQLVASPEALDRFRREVRLAARLAHPNVVTVHDADEVGGMHFLVMEYVDGVSLDQLVARKGPLAVGMACQLIRQAALGLQHAFDKGMVHRDIKPQNLMVTRKGQVKVLDFGLARRVPEGPARKVSSVALTTPGFFLGTPDFVSPEQARDPAAADIRSDLYSLGCTLYFLLTGRPPFGGDSALSKLVAHAEVAAPPLAALRPDAPAGLGEVLARLMAKDPADRYQTPSDAAAALHQFTKVTPETADTVLATVDSRPPRPRRRRRQSMSRRGWMIAAGVVLAGLAAAAITAIVTRPKRDVGGTGQSRTELSGGSGGTTGDSPGILFVLAPSDFSGTEYTTIRRVLVQEGCRIKLMSAARGPVTPRGGGQSVTAELALGDAAPKDWDALVLCGGQGVGVFLDHNPLGPAMTRLLREFTAAGRVVAGIDSAPGVLADAGVLTRRRATAATIVRQKFGQSITWDDVPVVTDGIIVTARDEPAADEFARAVIAAVRKNKSAK